MRDVTVASGPCVGPFRASLALQRHAVIRLATRFAIEVTADDGRQRTWPTAERGIFIGRLTLRLPGHAFPHLTDLGLQLAQGVDLRRTLPELAALLAPGGVLALATLGNNTFKEWRAAHTVAGLRPATPDYPDAKTLADAFPSGMTVEVAEEDFAEPLTDALDFMRGLRRIGADTPAPGSKPLTPGRMRQVLRAFSADGQTSYHLLYAIALRSSSTSQPRTTR